MPLKFRTAAHQIYYYYFFFFFFFFFLKLEGDKILFVRRVSFAPGGVVPTVAVKGEDADFSCLNSQGTPRVVIDIIDIENQRQIRKADNTISLRKVGK